MKTTFHTLIEQLKITKREIERRKEYLDFTDKDVQALVSYRENVVENIDEIVEEFYKRILPFDEMDRVIGDAETLRRLKNHQRSYILTLFDGQYDEDYVHSRLRVGVVHKRIGVDPKFYVSAVHNLSTILRNLIIAKHKGLCKSCAPGMAAIEKIIMFDLSLTFDTYIYSLMDETRRSKEELEHYTVSLEEVISDRTKLLKEQASHDGLTGLLNQQAFYSELKRELSRGLRRNHSTTLIYFDLDEFKKINDAQGHKRGDEVLQNVAESIRQSIRDGEIGARYGGDEFCIILPESTIEDGQNVCNRIKESFEKNKEISEIKCSMGIAISTPEKPLDSTSLVKAADKAMYEAKKQTGFSINFSK
ncbi:MAG: GGDEF domain-containing protein [Spirochaetia bacterium]|nr:GGDEF domain-containing protein [Spirochaetia bacterium]